MTFPIGANAELNIHVNTSDAHSNLLDHIEACAKCNQEMTWGPNSACHAVGYRIDFLYGELGGGGDFVLKAQGAVEIGNASAMGRPKLGNPVSLECSGSIEKVQTRSKEFSEVKQFPKFRGPRTFASLEFNNRYCLFRYRAYRSKHKAWLSCPDVTVAPPSTTLQR